MIGARNWLLATVVAAVGLGCGSDAGSPKGSGGSGGGGGSGSGGASGGTVGTGGHAGSSGGAGIGGGGAGIGGGGAGVGGHGGAGAGGGGAGGAAAGGDGRGGGGAGGGGHAGSGGATGGAGGASDLCGGIAGLQCNGAVTEFCYFGDGSCGAGDKQGHCELAGGGLCQQPKVVCGCDGKTYSSACQAASNGFDITNNTSCIPGNGGDGANCGADTDCMSGYKCCVTGGRVGSPIACRQVAAGAACPALP